MSQTVFGRTKNPCSLRFSIEQIPFKSREKRGIDDLLTHQYRKLKKDHLAIWLNVHRGLPNCSFTQKRYHALADLKSKESCQSVSTAQTTTGLGRSNERSTYQPNKRWNDGEWKNKSTNEKTDERMENWTSERTDERRKTWTNEGVNKGKIGRTK